MAVWGKYGGRMRKKNCSTNPNDSPECCELLIKNGAEIDVLDIYNTTPLGTACGTGGDRCIEMLIAAGANINHKNIDGITALHECIYRGNIECL